MEIGVTIILYRCRLICVCCFKELVLYSEGLSLLYVLIQEQILEGLCERKGQKRLLDPPSMHWEVPCHNGE